MNVLIDFESEVPIYVQLRNEIVKGIAKGNLENGYSLPSVRALASDIGINMHTVNKAYAILKSEGYITLDRRHGAFISVCKKEEDGEKFQEEFMVIISSCIAKGMDKSQIDNIVKNIYKDLKGDEKL